MLWACQNVMVESFGENAMSNMRKLSHPAIRRPALWALLLALLLNMVLLSASALAREVPVGDGPRSFIPSTDGPAWADDILALSKLSQAEDGVAAAGSSRKHRV